MLQVVPLTMATAMTNETSNAHTSRSAGAIEEILNRFFSEEWPANKGKLSWRLIPTIVSTFVSIELYAEEDIELIKTSEWYVKRFLLAASRKTDKAYENLRTTLRWRKEHKLHEVKPSEFPREFYEIGGLFTYECDREGRPTIYMRIRMHRKISELVVPIQQFLFYNIFRMDQEYNHRGVTIIFDCQSVGYANVDLDLLKSLIDVAYQHFPFVIQRVLVYEMHWMLNAVRKMAMALMPANMTSLLVFVNKNDITEYIVRESLPDFMGGTCKRNYRAVPEGCVTVNLVAREHNISDEAFDRIMAIFEPFLEEARKEESLRKQSEPEVMVDVREAEPDAQDVAINEVAKEEALQDFETKSTAIVYRSDNSYTSFASIYPQSVLKFEKAVPVEANTLSSLVVLKNEDQTSSLAFKVQSNHPENYTVTPNEGVLLPGVYICIRFRLKADVDTRGDKFLLLLRPGVQLNNQSLTRADFDKLFHQHLDQVHSHKFLVDAGAHHQQPQLRSAMAEGDTSEKKLESEVRSWKRKYHAISSRQKWYNYLMLSLFVIFFAIMMAQFWDVNAHDTKDMLAELVDTYVKPRSTNTTTSTTTTTRI